MHMGLELRLSQELIMRLQLLMAIKLLQMNRVELADVVERCAVRLSVVGSAGHVPPT